MCRNLVKSETSPLILATPSTVQSPKRADFRNPEDLNSESLEFDRPDAYKYNDKVLGQCGKRDFKNVTVQLLGCIDFPDWVTFSSLTCIALINFL